MLALYLTYIDDESDKKLYEQIYSSYRKQMFLVAKSVLHNETDAEDVVHDVFLNIAIKHMKTLQSLSGDIHKRNYLLKATKNTALNWNKKKKVELRADEEIIEYKGLERNHKDFVEDICEKMEYEQVVTAIKMLDAKYRDVLYFHYMLDLQVPKVAELLHQTVSTTKKQLVRGKKKLLILLQEEGVGEEKND